MQEVGERGEGGRGVLLRQPAMWRIKILSPRKIAVPKVFHVEHSVNLVRTLFPQGRSRVSQIVATKER